ncbi:MAG: hypothetical protein KAV87_27165, partial [Desulfobacteraceae bacterium]|nr:hypothetical protein [Desulfobacteraceae bacterium]
VHEVNLAPGLATLSTKSSVPRQVRMMNQLNKLIIGILFLILPLVLLGVWARKYAKSRRRTRSARNP